MEAIFNNPFRVLGLPITATERQIAKRVSDLEIYTDLGKPIKYETDFDFIPDVKRTPESIREAYSRIERPDGKVLYSFFWFYKKSNVDGMCFDLLAKGNVEKAIELWERNQEESNKNIDIFSSKRNLMVMYLLDSYNETLSSFERALLNTKWILADDKNINKYIEEVWGRKYTDRVENIKRDVLEEIHDGFKGFVGDNHSVTVKEFLNLFKKLPEKYADFIINKYVSGPICRIEEEIQRASDSIKKEPGKAEKIGKKLYKVTTSELSLLKDILTKKDSQYQTIADKLANMLLQCLIAYYNEKTKDKSYSDSTESLLILANYAKEIAVSKQLQDQINENIKFLRVSDSFEKVSRSIKRAEAAAKGGIYGHPRIVESLIEDCKGALMEIKRTLGATDNLCKQVSEAVAATALGLCIDYANRSQDYKSILPVVRKIGSLDMSSELRAKYLTNLSILEKNLSIQQQGQGCYIATMVYKDKMAREVLTFKKFRDRTLKRSFPGRFFIKLYYFLSPAFVRLFKNSKRINTIMKRLLDKLLTFIGDEND